MLPKYVSSRPSASVTAVLMTCWSAGTAAGLRSLPSRRWELAKSAPSADRGPPVHCLGDRAGPGSTPSREDDLTARGEVVELADTAWLGDARDPQNVAGLAVSMTG